MLPRSTNERMNREKASAGKSGRSQEISRLIGRSLRCGVDMRKLGEFEIRVDCDVLQADGGTRVAAITGGFVALAKAIEHLIDRRRVRITPISHMIAAVSAGLVGGKPTLDLDYVQDSNADTDGSFVFNQDGQIVDMHVSAEKQPLVGDDFATLMTMSSDVVTRVIIPSQREALKGCRALP